MKRFCFLVQCCEHSAELSGKLAILTTDCLKIGRVEQPDASRFTPGTSISWVPLTNGSCNARILVNLRLAGYDESVHQEHMKTLRDMPTEWTTPGQFIEVKYITI